MGTVAAIARGYRADAGLVPEPTRLQPLDRHARAPARDAHGRGPLGPRRDEPAALARGRRSQRDPEGGCRPRRARPADRGLGRARGQAPSAPRARPSVNPTIVSGGSFISNVPERCDVALNTTYLPGNADERGLRLDPEGRDRAGGCRGGAVPTTGSPSTRRLELVHGLPAVRDRPRLADRRRRAGGRPRARRRRARRGHRHDLRRRAPDALRRDPQPRLRPRRPQARARSRRMGGDRRARARGEALRARDRRAGAESAE